MADKQITVAVPEERVPQFYAWFAQFLASEDGLQDAWPGGRGGFGHHGFGHRGPGHRRGRTQERAPWTDDDLERAGWLYSKLSEPARQLFDLLMDSPDTALAGNDAARRLSLEKGAHGVAGILAWPGRWAARLGRDFPIEADASQDGGTVYRMDAPTADLFRRARAAGNR